MSGMRGQTALREEMGSVVFRLTALSGRRTLWMHFGIVSWSPWPGPAAGRRRRPGILSSAHFPGGGA